jgi:hypothetical protein
MAVPTKGQINRAGTHLAAALGAMRAGERPALIVDERDEEARAIVEWWRDEHVEPMLAVSRVVQGVVSPVLIDALELRLVTSRSKRFATIVDKLDRGSVKLADMVDLGGVPAVMDNIEDVDHAALQLGRQLEVRRVRDWARNPPASGYRAVHLHVRHDGRAIEIQLRTRGQDTWANVVEEESRLTGLNYKAGQGHVEVLEFLRAISDFTAAMELGESHPEAFRRSATASKPRDPSCTFPGLPI